MVHLITKSDDFNGTAGFMIRSLRLRFIAELALCVLFTVWFAFATEDT